MLKDRKISYLLFVFIFLLKGFVLFGGSVSLDKAKLIAVNWYNNFAPGVQKNSNIKSHFIVEEQNKTLYYVFCFSKGGYVFVSGDDVITPVLAYSFEAEIPDETFNPALKAWSFGYNESINIILKQKSEKNADPLWAELQNNNFSYYKQKSYNEVKPLIGSLWNQGSGWNKYCPEDKAGYSGHVPVGCVAVALAQVMKRWNYPNYGNGANSYTHPKYGVIAADFGKTRYYWREMADSIPNDYNALLLSHCGVALNMGYSSFSSATDTHSKPIIALTEYFNYDKDMTYKKRSDYSNEQWRTLIRNELVNGRPLIYRAQDSFTKAGHAFNIDGFQNLYFHFNWGWGGKGNGYFLLEVPRTGPYEFSLNQGGIFGIYPKGMKVFPPPENIRAEELTGRIILDWKPPFNEEHDHYNIYRDDKYLISTKNIFYTDSTVLDNIEYIYHVTAVYKGGKNGESNVFNQVSASSAIQYSTPFIENFENDIQNWKISENIYEWSITNREENGHLHCLPYTSAGHRMYPDVAGNMAITPYLDLSKCKKVNLSFDYFFKYFIYHQKFEVYYRLSDKSEWELLFCPEYTEFMSDKNWKSQSVILPKKALCSGLQLGFYYESGMTRENYYSLGIDQRVGIGLDNLILRDMSIYAPPDNFLAMWLDSSIRLKYSKPLNTEPDYYNIYKDDSLLNITTDSIFIDMDVNDKQTYTYFITSVYNELESSRTEIIDVYPVSEDVIPYKQNFEDKQTDWLIEESPVKWSINTLENSGILTSNYSRYIISNNNEQSGFPGINRIISPWFKLLGKEGIMISFDYILMMGNNQVDLSILYRTSNDFSWKKISDLQITGDWDSWQREYIELPDNTINENIQLAFLFETNGNVGKLAGVDNIEIKWIRKNTTPEKLEYIEYGSYIGLKWDSPKQTKPNRYNIYRNDSLIGYTGSTTYSDKSYNPDLFTKYRVSSVFSDINVIESKPTEAVNVYVKAPYKQEFVSDRNGWSVNGRPNHFNIQDPYHDKFENLANETGFVYYGGGYDIKGEEDIIISPQFRINQNNLTLVFDYIFDDYENENNKLIVNYRYNYREKWKILDIIPATETYRLYQQYKIQLGEEFINREIQFAFQYTNGPGNIPVYIRMDNFEIKDFTGLEPAKNLTAAFNNGYAELSWDKPENNKVKYYNVIRNLKKIGETKECAFVDNNVNNERSYYYRVYAVYGDLEKRESISSNQILVNPEPVFNLPYFEDFNRANNIQWKSDQVFWEYNNNEKFGIYTSNPTPFFGFNVNIPEWIRYDSWLVSPFFRAVEEDSICLSFKYMFKCFYPEMFQNLQLYYKLENESSWIFLEEINKTPSSDQWMEYQTMLPSDSLTTNFQIGFFAHRTRPYSSLIIGGIDDISLKSIIGLEPPENLFFEPGNGLIKLKWDAPDGGKPSQYNIYRNDSLIGESKIQTYSDYQIQNLVKYNYKVKAFYSGLYKGESLPAEIKTAISTFSSSPPYFWDFNDNNGGWDISGNPVGWMRGKRNQIGNSNYLYTNFELWPPEDMVRSPYISLEYFGSLFISFDYCAWGGDNQIFNLVYRNVNDTAWTKLKSLPVNSGNLNGNFERVFFRLPKETYNNCVQFGFYYQDPTYYFGYTAFDNFLIDGSFGVFAPDSLGFKINDRIVDLFWNSPQERQPDLYNIYRNDSLYASCKDTLYSDINVQNGVKYKYWITAVFQGENPGESYSTNRIEVSPYPYIKIPYIEDFEGEKIKWFISGSPDSFKIFHPDDPGFGISNNTKYVGIETKSQADTYLISSLIDLSHENSSTISFNYCLDKYYFFNHLFLSYRNNPSSEWTVLKVLENTDNLWVNQKLILSEEIMSDSLQLMFYFNSFGITATTHAAGIDDIIIDNQLTDIIDNKTVADVKIFPNPTSGILNLLFFDMEGFEPKIEIISVTGITIYDKYFNTNETNSLKTININHHPKGLYFARIRYHDEVIIQKIVLY